MNVIFNSRKRQCRVKGNSTTKKISHASGKPRSKVIKFALAVALIVFFQSVRRRIRMYRASIAMTGSRNTTITG